MHVVSPERYQQRPQRRKKLPWVIIPLVFVLGVAAANYLRPLPAATATLTISTPPTAQQAVAWPSGGQQAIAASGYGLLATNGSQAPLATASIAKVITALCVLQKQPLAIGQSGPTYILGASDVNLYETYAAQGGSLIPVVEGEALTEYQALEALMIPSANNIADSLVAKVFGSQTAYVAYATTYLQQQGLVNTHVGSDASGFSPDTTSTASDLASLGLLALQSPVLMSIAGERSTTLPVAGTVHNYDTVLGQNGITGLKTGNNDADPGAFLFTATMHIGGKDIPLTGSVMGAADLDTALASSVQLVESLQHGFEQVQIAKAGQALGTLRTAWGSSSSIVSANNLQLVRWKAVPLTERHTVHTDIHSGEVGSLQIAAGQAKSVSTLRLQHAVAGPSFWWRLTRH